MGWTIRHGSTDYEVEAPGPSRVARLLADGAEVDERTAGYWESETLTHGDVTVEVSWGPRNSITSCHLDVDGTRTPLVPPPGLKQARREAFAREHPTQFVLRRVAVAGAEIVIGVLGVSALVSAFLGSLLPRLNLPSIPFPDVELPSAPGWLRYVDPGYWLGRLGLSWPDVSLPAWLDPVVDSSRYWLPLLIAAGIALGELDRRRKRDAERDDPDHGPHDESDSAP